MIAGFYAVLTAVLFAPLQVLTPETTPVTVLLLLLSSGLVGMSIRDMVNSITADDEKAVEESDDLGGDGLMGNEDGGGGGNLGGLNDLDGDGDLGGFDDSEFGEMGDEGGSGGNVDELEHRLDELENEVGSLSSTVNTVRNENEQISDSVQEVEENVRKLLDIYEMVTRGVNPFADDMQADMGGMGDDSAFGLFADDGQEETTDVDESVTEAEADDFFEDDFDDGGDIEDSLDDDAEDPFADDFDDETSDSGGTSFDELKDEYESGDADWVEDEDEEFEAIGDGKFEEDNDEFEDVGEDTADESGDEFDELDDSDDPGAENNDKTAVDAKREAEPTEPEETTETNTSETASIDSESGSGKPYVASLPEGFASDLIVVEWLEFLVEEGGIQGAARALTYYEKIGWINQEVARDLESYLDGFDDTGGDSLMIDHHKQSLEYITQLNRNGETSTTPTRNRHRKTINNGIQR